MSLSDKMVAPKTNYESSTQFVPFIYVDDVKEFIKKVSRRAMTWIEAGQYDEFMNMVKEEAGPKLINTNNCKEVI